MTRYEQECVNNKLNDGSLSSEQWYIQVFLIELT